MCEEYSYSLIHVPYQFKPSQIFKKILKTVLEFYGMLEFIPNQYKPEMICEKLLMIILMQLLTIILMRKTLFPIAT